MRFSGLLSATVLAVVSTAFAQPPTPVCWKARDCPNARWETKANLLAYGNRYCNRIQLNPVPPFETFNGISSASTTGRFSSPNECFQVFRTIVETCHGKGNGGYMSSFSNPAATRLYVTAGDCEAL